MTSGQEERMIQALEKIADAMISLEKCIYVDLNENVHLRIREA